MRRDGADGSAAPPRRGLACRVSSAARGRPSAEADGPATRARDREEAARPATGPAGGRRAPARARGRRGAPCGRRGARDGDARPRPSWPPTGSRDSARTPAASPAAESARGGGGRSRRGSYASRSPEAKYACPGLRAAAVRRSGRASTSATDRRCGVPRPRDRPHGHRERRGGPAPRPFGAVRRHHHRSLPALGGAPRGGGRDPPGRGALLGLHAALRRGLGAAPGLLLLRARPHPRGRLLTARRHRAAGAPDRPHAAAHPHRRRGAAPAPARDARLAAPAPPGALAPAPPADREPARGVPPLGPVHDRVAAPRHPRRRPREQRALDRPAGLVPGRSAWSSGPRSWSRCPRRTGSGPGGRSST